MGLFGPDEDDIILENANIDCEPQNDFVSKKQVKPIDDKLSPGEKVHYLFTGGSGLEIDGEKDDRVGSTRTAITDQRILIKVSKTWGMGYQTIRYNNINGVTLNEGVLSVALVINTTGNRYKVYLTEAGAGSAQVGHEAVEFIRKKVRHINQESSESENENSQDPIEKLGQLKELMDEGVITEEEFNNKKKELLDEI